MDGLMLAEWTELWGAKSGAFNCSTATYDVGNIVDNCINRSCAVNVAVTSPQAPFTVREEVATMDSCYGSGAQIVNVTQYAWGGVLILALEAICFSLKIRCKLYETADDDAAVITHNAVLEDVLDGSADVGVGGLVMTMSRYMSNNYSVIDSTVKKSYSLVIHKKFLIEGHNDMERILDEFSLGTWLAAAALSVILGLILAVFVAFRNRVAGISSTWLKCLSWSFLHILLSDFDCENQRKYSRAFSMGRRLLIVTILIYTLLFQSVVLSTLPAILAVSTSAKLPFSTTEEFLNSSFELWGSDVVKEVLMTSSTRRFRLLGSKMKTEIDNNDLYMSAVSPEGKRRAYLMNVMDKLALSELSCDFVEVISDVVSAPVGSFWFRKDHPLYSKFLKRFRWLSVTGIVDFDLGYYTEFAYDKLRAERKTRSCVAHKMGSQGRRQLTMKGITVADFHAPLTALLFCWLTGLFVMIMEKLHWYWRCSRRM
ncbi:uncharacterized protein LOC129597614 [Paramacrobiotus metropolitanus]|uniref:uncharacterized protein LOC129597614 n=1 Tax=Paramacrobiotus metropolitanus TaxID=2943436 RepID=UPI00244651F6|nr:uncharacterized protein LOC129597614 [Paramacrobiotus metropolitanus]